MQKYSRISIGNLLASDLFAIRLRQNCRFGSASPPLLAAKWRSAAIFPLKRNIAFSRAYSTQAQSPKAESKLSRLLREYGKIALVVYLGLTFIVFSGCYASIVFFDVEGADVLRKIKEITGSLPVSIGEPTKEHEAEIDNAVKEQKSSKSIATTFLLTLAMTKLFSPIKVMLTAAFTPILARRLRRMGFDIGSKTGANIRNHSIKKQP